MKTGWEEKTLGEVCIVERGSSPRPIERYVTTDGNGVNWIKIGDTKGVNKYLYKTREKITQDGAKQSRYVKEGDFILSNSMSFGNPFVMKTSGYIHDGWFVLRLPDYVETDYFYYLLISPNVRQQFDTLANGAIVKNISGDLVKRVKLPIPSLSEQQRIVAILDEAFAAIDQAKANAQRNLQNARELFDSYLQSVFANPGEGWEEKILEEVCLIKPSKSEVRGRLTNSDMVSFSPMEYLGINQKYLESRQTKSLNEVVSSYTYFAEGDVLLAKITPCFENGKLGIARNLENSVGFGSSEYIVFRPDFSLNNEFLYYFLSREVFRKEGAENMSGAVGHKRVKKEFIENYSISFPSIVEQKNIVIKLDALSVETKKLEAIYQQKLIDLDELKKSILQKAFRGELTTAPATALAV